MDKESIESLCKKGTYNKEALIAKLIETHISWVLLTKNHAFKIKKPVKLDFLDFSSLQQRKYFCEQEVELNSRFTDIYLGVVPIYKLNDQWIIGGDKGALIDYAVQMEKLDAEQRMDQLALSGKINEHHINQLASVIAAFHQTAKIVQPIKFAENLASAFKGLGLEKGTVVDLLGAAYGEIVDETLKIGQFFVDQNKDLLNSRVAEGWVRDVHGDLHMQNIFLCKEPVIFDCIEFNLAFREIDILNEVAFLCMDFDAKNMEIEGATLLKTYLGIYAIGITALNHPLFIYYKLYRANIRAKISALQVNNLNGDKENVQKKSDLKMYLLLCKRYIYQLKSTGF